MQPPHRDEQFAVQEADSQESGRLLDRLKRLGITDWHEPLLCLPLGFHDYSRPSTLKQALAQADVVSEPHIFSLVVSIEPIIFNQPKKRIVLTATDGMLSVKLVTFVFPGADIPRWKGLQAGERIHIKGTLQNWNGTLQMTGPTFIEPEIIGRIIPQYEKRRGVVAEGAILDATRYALVHHVQATVTRIVESFEGLSETDILAHTRLRAPDIETILRAAHDPISVDEGQRGVSAMRRLAALSVVENARRLKQRNPVPESVVDIPNAMLVQLAGKLPYQLTNDQRQAIREIVADMASPLPMRRVLSGDVGCGKSVCIMIPALATQALGLRAVILTPNTLLADQFAKECKEHFGDDTNIVVVTAGTKNLDLADNPVLVGTTALLSRLNGEVAPHFLAVDEEQKLSVGQKQELSNSWSNYLQATATPIPRTTARISHSAMDVSIVREMPVAKTITSYIVREDERKRLFNHTRRILESGGQVAIVYPIVDDAEQERKSVVAAASEWEKHFPGQVGMVHGQMKESEKLTAIGALKSGQHRIAVVSAIIEIGLTFKDLISLIVVHAERYGTSTLHQFRGRVARKGGSGHFFLYLPEPVSKESMARLNLVKDNSDGFILSEKDAEMRGYGDLFESAERQSGNSRSNVFRCAELTPSEIHAAANQFQ